MPAKSNPFYNKYYSLVINVNAVAILIVVITTFDPLLQT